MERADTRTTLLLGEENIAKLQASTVCILGIGGVGSYCAEALARSGIERILQYRPDIDVQCMDVFYQATINEQLFDQPIDFVVDAIDTIRSKCDCIEYCLINKIPFISSMGMANRLDPTKITIMDLMRTSYDPLAKVMRNLMRKSSVKGKIPVVCSLEQPSVQTKIINEDGVTRKQKMPPASSPFVPAAAGLACASYVVRMLIGKDQK